MQRSRLRLLALLLAACLACDVVQALEAGAPRWVAEPGQPARALIEVRGGAGFEAAHLRARIASAEAYRVAGLVPHPGLATVTVSVRPAPGRTAVVELGGLPADVPALPLLLSLNDRRSMTLARVDLDTRAAARAAVAPAPSAALPPEVAQAQARAALQAWAAAWSRRDVEAYVAAYVPDYAGRDPEGDRREWIEQRRARILGRQSIAVEIADLQLQPEREAMVARFEQRYRADGLADRSTKRIVLVPVGGRWLIRSETELP